MDQIRGDDPLPKTTLVYLAERSRNAMFDYVHRKFRQAQKERGLTKQKLALRLSKDPAVVNRLLGAPGNWTLDTVSELLVGICREEFLPDSRSFLGRTARNARPKDIARFTIGNSVNAQAADTRNVGARFHVKLQQ